MQSAYLQRITLVQFYSRLYEMLYTGDNIITNCKQCYLQNIADCSNTVFEYCLEDNTLYNVTTEDSTLYKNVHKKTYCTMLSTEDSNLDKILSTEDSTS